MSRIAAVFHMPGVDQEQYDQMIQDFEAADNGVSEGRIIHVGMPEDGGWFAFDVWESVEAFERMGAILMPILQKHGIAPPDPIIYPVHNIMG